VSTEKSYEYKNIVKTGFSKVSEVGLDAWQWGMTLGPVKDKGQRLFFAKRLLDHGSVFLIQQDVYERGLSEQRIGQWRRP